MASTTNVAARVEQLTKTTGDSILLTQLADRGVHALKGKSAPTRVFGLDPMESGILEIGSGTVRVH